MRWPATRRAWHARWQEVATRRQDKLGVEGGGHTAHRLCHGDLQRRCVGRHLLASPVAHGEKGQRLRSCRRRARGLRAASALAASGGRSRAARKLACHIPQPSGARLRTFTRGGDDRRSRSRVGGKRGGGGGRVGKQQHQRRAHFCGRCQSRAKACASGVARHASQAACARRAGARCVGKEGQPRLDRAARARLLAAPRGLSDDRLASPNRRAGRTQKLARLQPRRQLPHELRR